MNIFISKKRTLLEKMLADLLQRYEAKHNELGCTTDESEKLVIKKQLEVIEKEIEETQDELDACSEGLVPESDNRKTQKEQIGNNHLPSGFILPSGYSYIETGQPGIHVLLRQRDNQTVLYLPAGGKVNKPFIIDKYLITNAQYAHFLNDSEVKDQIYDDFENGVRVVTLNDQRLIGDAITFWKTWKGCPKNGDIWGLQFVSGRWQPIAGSEDFPVTLITALGASCYAVWANNIPIHQLGTVTSGFYLPTENEWLTAALWNYTTHREQNFPWDDVWNNSCLNSASYWAGRCPQPTPVKHFPNGASPSGMMDAFGNVWEWLADSPSDKQHLIKGGACTSSTSPQDNFHKAIPIQADRGLPHCGFRCCRTT